MVDEKNLSSAFLYRMDVALQAESGKRFYRLPRLHGFAMTGTNLQRDDSAAEQILGLLRGVFSACVDGVQHNSALGDNSRPGEEVSVRVPKNREMVDKF